MEISEELVAQQQSEALVAQQQVVRLQALLEASRQLHSTIELNDVLHIALEIVVRELELTGAFFTTFPQSYGEVTPEFQASPAPQRVRIRQVSLL